MDDPSIRAVDGFRGGTALVIRDGAPEVASAVVDMANFLISTPEIHERFVNFLRENHGHAINPKYVWENLQAMADKFSNALGKDGHSEH